VLSNKEVICVSVGTELERASAIATRKSGAPGLLLAKVASLLAFHKKNATRNGSSGAGAGSIGTTQGLWRGMIAICR
jgi:hypothetical protein